MRELAFLIAVLALPLSASAAAPALKKDNPTKPIRFIVGFAPGGAPGHVSRRPVRGEGADAAGFIKREIAKWARVVRNSGARAD